MWSTLSSSQLVLLLSLAAVLLCSKGTGQFITLPCCRNVINNTPGNITKCYEQLPRRHCKVHAYVIKKQDGNKVCIDPNSKWIKDKLKKGLECPPDVSLSR